MNKNMTTPNIGPMLNLYPDSVGGSLSSVIRLLRTAGFQDAFQSMYILPSLYHTDLDRGFSVIDYELNGENATAADLDALREMNIDLKLDFILNHLSVQSPEFQDLLKHGEDSPYRDFFINWNEFWQGCGETNAEGYIVPEEKYLRDMFFRKEGLPLLMVRFPDGKKVPYWNTFYQEVFTEEDGTERYLGQMDLNINSPRVWEYYKKTLGILAGYGAGIVRLDAFAYAPKEPGRRNFLNEPETWDLLSRLGKMASEYQLILLPEIHAAYGEKTYLTLAEKGYPVYDFFLPGLLIDAIESGDGRNLAAWITEITTRNIQTIHMLGCHDGIPMLDLKGLLSDERIEELIALLKSRGGHVKDLHGQKNLYYQVNSTYFSALEGNEKKLLLARAIQMFMPGKPQIWYLDLLAGENDYEAVKRAGAGGHKEINRTNLSVEEAKRRLTLPVVQEQLRLIRLRNTHPVFSKDADISVQTRGSEIIITWKTDKDAISLQADLKTFVYTI